MNRDFVRAARELAIPYLILHREEFTWPLVLPQAPVSSYLTVSPIAFFKAGLFSVALVVVCFTKRPVVNRLAALWCSDFPLNLISDRPTRFHCKASKL